jgi:K+-sensing histidine kinase KdpD
VAAILVPFRSSFANTASALILVGVIVAVATLDNRVSGFVATVSATLWFDYFLTRPYEKLAITHRPDIETAVSLFVVGIIVTELAARSRHHHATAVEEADSVGLIHDVSELAASGAPSREVIERVRREMVFLLHLRECRYESGQADTQ